VGGIPGGRGFASDGGADDFFILFVLIHAPYMLQILFT